MLPVRLCRKLLVKYTAIGFTFVYGRNNICYSAIEKDVFYFQLRYIYGLHYIFISNTCMQQAIITIAA